MFPKLLGPYLTFVVNKMGSGATQRQAEQQLKWFAAVSPDNKVLVQPMSEDLTLSGLVKIVPSADFYINYNPDIPIFCNYIAPDMKMLDQWIGPKGSPPPASPPSGRIARMFSGFLSIIRGHPTSKIKQEDYDTVRGMLEAVIGMDVMACFQKSITGEAIFERKQGNYSQALSYYNRSMALGGKDSHLLFNMARVYYEMGDIDQAKNCLEEALKSSPDLEPARKFLEFISGHAA